MQLHKKKTAPNKAATLWESLSVDVTMLPAASSFRYVLVMSGNASSYMWVVPMPKQNAKNNV